MIPTLYYLVTLIRPRTHEMKKQRVQATKVTSEKHARAYARKLMTFPDEWEVLDIEDHGEEMKIEAKLPEGYEPVSVALAGEDGNAYAIMGRIAGAMRKAGQSEHVAEYEKQATSDDYNHLLLVSMTWTKQLGEDDDEYDDES